MESQPILAAFVALAFIESVIAATSLANVRDIQNLYSQSVSNKDGTYFGKYHSGGRCTLDPLPPMATRDNWIVVAAGPNTYKQSLGCGMCLKISGKGEGNGHDHIIGTTYAVTVDECAGGCGQYGMDFCIPSDGRWKINYKAIDCPTIPGPNGKVQFLFQGSNPWYIKLQARNTKVPTAGIEVILGDKYHCLTRHNDNFFVGEGLGKFSPPLRVRLTAITGEQVETSIDKIEDDKIVIQSRVQFKGMEVGSHPASDIKCFGQGDKHPYPSGRMKPGAGAGDSPCEK